MLFRQTIGYSCVKKWTVCWSGGDVSGQWTLSTMSSLCLPAWSSLSLPQPLYRRRHPASLRRLPARCYHCDRVLRVHVCCLPAPASRRVAAKLARRGRPIRRRCRCLADLRPRRAGILCPVSCRCPAAGHDLRSVWNDRETETTQCVEVRHWTTLVCWWSAVFSTKPSRLRQTNDCIALQ